MAPAPVAVMTTSATSIRARPIRLPYYAGGARAKNFAYAPAAPEDLAGPLPLIVLDNTPMPEE